MKNAKGGTAEGQTPDLRTDGNLQPEFNETIKFPSISFGASAKLQLRETEPLTHEFSSSSPFRSGTQCTPE